MEARRISPVLSIPWSLDDEEWADFLYLASNSRGMHAERWRHMHGCGRFFNACRDTMSE